MVAAALALALTRAPAPADTLPSDPKLDAKIPLEARIEPLPDALAALGRAAGVPLSVDPKMRALKTTILTGPRPLRRTLADLAAVFDAEWTPVPPDRGGGYRLAMTVPARNRLDAYLRRKSDRARAGMVEELRRVALVAGTPWTRLAEARRSATEAIGRFRLSTDPGFPEAHDRYEAFAQISPELYFLGIVARTLDPRALERFLSGEPLVASAASRGGAIPLPRDAAGYVEIAGEFLIRRPGEDGSIVPPNAPLPTARLFLRYDPETGFLRTIFARGDGGTSGRTETLSPSQPSADPYEDALRAWRTDLETTNAPELTLPLAKTDPEPSPWAGPHVTGSEHLAQLRRQTGLDVIAEASRAKSAHKLKAFLGPTLRDALKDWGYEANVRVESGALLARPQWSPNHRADEPPEAPLRRYESLPNPGLDDRATLVASLPLRVARKLSDMAARRKLTGIGSGLPALRIWGSLSASERASLLAGAPLRFAAMSPATRALAESAILDAVFEDGVLPNSLLALLDAPGGLAGLGGLTIWPMTKDVLTPGMAFGYGDGTMDRIPPAPGVALELGPAPGQGVLFILPR